MGASLYDLYQKEQQQGPTKPAGDSLYAQYQAEQQRAAKPEHHESPSEFARGAVSSLYQGLTLGAGNKLTALTRTVLPQSMGGVKGFDFPEALKEETESLEAFRNRHPIANAAAEGIGSVAPILATGGAGIAADAVPASRLARVGQLAKSGAAYGGATAGLSSNRLQDVPSNILKGGAEGALLAPVIGGASSLAARGGVAIARRGLPNSPLLAEAGRAVGGGPVTADEHAESMLHRALEKGGVDPTGTASTLARSGAQDLPTTALDLGSRPALSLARQARNVPGSNAGQILDDFLRARGAGAGQRVEEALTSGTGHAPTDIELPVEQLAARRAQEAKPLYEAAYAHGEINDPETVQQIKVLLKNPTFAKAWKRGQQLIELEQGPQQAPAGIDPKRFKELQAQGLDRFLPNVTKSANPTVQQLDAWKKGLDAVIESGYGSTNALSKAEARLYRQKLNEVLDRIDAEVPQYAEARGSYAGNSELKEAAEAGASHFSPSTSADYLARTLPAMSKGEQDAYRSNAINAFVAKLRTMAANPDVPDAARGVNVVQRLLGTSDAGRKLRMLFPNEGAYNEFVAKMEQEAQYPATNRFLTQQSSTAAQLAESQMSPNAWRDLALAPTSKYAAVRAGLRGLQAVGIGAPRISPAVADAVARRSTRTGEAMQDMLRTMASRRDAQIAARQRVAALLGNPVASTSQNKP